MSDNIEGQDKRIGNTRTLIADAWLSLVEEGYVEPTAQAVADRAKVGRRTVFVHFRDLNSLHRHAAELHLQRIAALLVVPAATGSFDDRVNRFVAARVALFERATPIRKASAAVQARSQMADAMMAVADQSLGSDTSKMFEAELDLFSPVDRHIVESALHVATSWASWNQLRARQNIDVVTGSLVMARHIRSLLR